MKKTSFVLLILVLSACNQSNLVSSQPAPKEDQAGDFTESFTPSPRVVPHVDRWGIYRLDINTQEIDLLYSSSFEIASLDLNHTGDRLVFSQKTGGLNNENHEIYTLSPESNEVRRITENHFWDLYPIWSPNGSQIAFLSQRATSLGIFVMDADGNNTRPLYDSSAHEADIHWVNDQIAFTRDNSIWIMQADGSGSRQVTRSPKAGEWGNANLPLGDYDPRISPDGTRIVFERLLDDQSPNGNYDFFVIDLASSIETRLTQSGYSQGLASWSRTGDQLVYVVAAIDTLGQYDLYLMATDGTQNRNITPPYFPPEFLCHWAVFSDDERAIYFIGEWWEIE